MSTSKSHKHSTKRRSSAPRSKRRAGELIAAVLLVVAVILVAGFIVSKVFGVESVGPVGVADPSEAEAARTRVLIDARLDAMSRAVLAGDQEAYLAGVWPGDPVLATEQKNWAADLVSHRPEAFSLQIDPDSLILTDASAEADLTMRWTMPGHKPRQADWRARFRPVPEGVLYAGRAWRRLQGPGVLVLFDPHLVASARRVLEAYPGVARHVQDGFQLRFDSVQQIKLYRSMANLQASIYLSYTDPLAGWNEPGESVKMLVRNVQSERAVQITLAHELGHVASFAMGERIVDAPWWVLEGVAELAAEQYTDSADRIDALVRRWASAGRLADWEDISDFRSTRPDLVGHVYAQGQHMVGFVSERWGRGARNRWLRQMARGSSLDQATRDALGLSWADLDQAWRASLLQDRGERLPIPE